MTINLADCVETTYDPTPATGGTRQFGDRARDILSVKDFGAVGNGMNDDTAAIQACIDEAITVGSTTYWENRPVHFPKGNYLITDTITFDRSYYAWIFGEGVGATRITWGGVATSETEVSPGVYTYVTPAMFVVSGGSKCIFEGMSFDGGTPKASWGIKADSHASAFLTGGTYSNLAFSNIGIIAASGQPLGIGIGFGFAPIDGASEQHVWNCSFTDCTYGLGIGNQNALGDMVVGCKFTRCYVGIFENTISIPTIIGCTFTDDYWGDIRTSSDHGVIVGCHGTTSQPYANPSWPGHGAFWPGPSFVWFSGSLARYISSCTHVANQVTNTSYFADTIGSDIIDNCSSNKGWHAGGASNSAGPSAEPIFPYPGPGGTGSYTALGCLRGSNIGSISGSLAQNI